MGRRKLKSWSGQREEERREQRNGGAGGQGKKVMKSRVEHWIRWPCIDK